MNKKKSTAPQNYSTRVIVILIPLVLAFVLCAISFFVFTVKPNLTKAPAEQSLPEIPKPEVTGGVRGELGIDKNVNEATIDQYLGRADSIYRDMRMLEDPANYEAINGDRFLSGFVEGFEVVPLPYLMPVTGLPEAVGDTYTGKTLFGLSEDGSYVANYNESMTILEELFPKDKNIFLMCGGGGYAGMTKNLLVSLGWDGDKIWNTGGYWYYEGEHNVQVKQTDEQGNVTYDFDLVKYHDIDFTKLTPKTSYALVLPSRKN